MHTTQQVLRSKLLGNERRVWIQPPPGDQPAEATCILLDGEYYVQRMDAPALLHQLQQTIVIPPTYFVYLSHIDGATRWPESFCNDRFAHFLAEEVPVWAAARFPPTRPYLIGLSLTGLAAAHAALLYPDAFSGVLCQSASFWWSDNWLVYQAAKQKSPAPQRFRIVCGNQETDDYVDHGNGLIQRTSQLAANQAMQQALREQGHQVSYHEYPGGHDLECWSQDLPNSLHWLLKSEE